MVTWRIWLGVAALLPIAAVWACSGSSKEGTTAPGHGGSAGATTGGTAGTAATAGSAGTFTSGGRPGGTGGTPVDAGEAGEGAGGSAGTFGGGGGRGGTDGGFGGSFGGAGTGAVGGFPSGNGGTSGGSGGTGGVPSGWTCSYVAYGDGKCHCGCGIPDIDCKKDDLDSCEVCSAFGSCTGGACPAGIDPDDTAHCIPPPPGWVCQEYYYHDGECTCGCGAPDPECADTSPASCDLCGVLGSCSGGTCPGSLDPNDNSKCSVPDGWTCSTQLYRDGFNCDCGCGVVDADCPSASVNVCDTCWNGCAGEGCPGPIDHDNNAICTGVPGSWTCSARFFGDGVQCNCGCGAHDPDCPDDNVASCDVCDLDGSCSAQTCPGLIYPTDARYCAHPNPPAGWTCPSYLYANGTCDCGCGTLDIDCRQNAISECDTCYACGSNQCPGRVDPQDVTACIPPPTGWHCDDNRYADGYTCDCGCGVVDLDCSSQLIDACSYCSPYAGSCSDYNCSTIDPQNNARCTDDPPPQWTCSTEYYGDRACDCGCGVVDIDCADATSARCVFCDDPGSCSNAKCSAGKIDPTNNAVCTSN